MSFSRDLKVAARSLARVPALWITVALTLALGIGANAAIFSVVRAVLRPLYGQDRLARLYRQIALHTSGPETVRQLSELNGAPAILIWTGDRLTSALWVECGGERITAIHSIRHPEKLARLEAVTKRAAAASLH